ncbi:glutamine amidotransferase-related protein [Rhodoferax antarcticus]|uniref:glutamine amidotransferase-related protein n=1 Tax=Rhodoferax antarcticus TaxID=81479 RepID=UPI002224B2EF|nr:amidotransferase [Rhodoferax antarcticus]MCW2311603.1 GMP synthase-like glutamine amidotransferase [Rhodoferax antarcticus]
MNLCILDNDYLDPAIEATYTGYGAMFERLLRDAGATGSFDIFKTYKGEYPATFDSYDAVLLTGSRADAFSQEPWVLALREKVEQLLQAKKKLVGVCFGHQLIGLILGARVGRAPQGWGAGRMAYQWLAPELPQAQGRTDIALLASHQDQVFDLPEGATLLATSAFCPVAAFAVEDRVFCVQPHPEFVEAYSAFLLDKRRAVLGEAQYLACTDSLAEGHDGDAVARMIVAFIAG